MQTLLFQEKLKEFICYSERDAKPTCHIEQKTYSLLISVAIFENFPVPHAHLWVSSEYFNNIVTSDLRSNFK